MSSNSTTTQVSAVVAGIIGAVVTIAVYFLHPSLANEAFSEGSGVWITVLVCGFLAGTSPGWSDRGCCDCFPVAADPARHTEMTHNDPYETIAGFSSPPAEPSVCTSISVLSARSPT